jgi:hypothetical protein
VLTDDDANEVEWVTGNDNWVHGQDCKVTIFVKDGSGKQDKGTKYPKRSGEWKVLSGTDLYCFGGKLKVK